MIRCDTLVILVLLALSLGPQHREACNRHIGQKLWNNNNNNMVSELSNEDPLSANEQLPRDSRALRRRNRNQQRRSQTDEATNSIAEDYYYDNPSEEKYGYYEDEEVLQQNIDGGSRRQGQHAAPVPVAPVASQSKQPVPPHHEIESGHYDTYQQPQKPSPLPGFLRTLAACLPLSLVAAAIPLGFANFDGATTTVTLNPATFIVTEIVTSTIMDAGPPASARIAPPIQTAQPYEAVPFRFYN